MAVMANTAGLLEQKYAGFYGDDPAHFAAVSKKLGVSRVVRAIDMASGSSTL